MTKSDAKISISLLEYAPELPGIKFFPHQMRHKKLHLMI